jgi:hypothetical protein
MTGASFTPQPAITAKPVLKVARPDIDAFLRSSLRNHAKARGPNPPDDTVARRMWALLVETDSLRQDPILQAANKSHSDFVRCLANANASTKLEKAQKQVAKEIEEGRLGDQEFIETLDTLLTGEALCPDAMSPSAEESENEAIPR